MSTATKHTLTIVVGTASPIKLAAIRKAFKKASAKIGPVFGADGIKLNLVSVAAKSNINEQPIGWEETIKGANNRAKNAVSLVPESTKARLVIAIENGCVEVPANGSNYHMDVGWILLRDLELNKDFVASSTSLTVPNGMLEELKNFGGPEKSTIGDVLHAKDSKISKKDPHTAMMSGLLQREAILEQALLSAVGQWLYAL